LALHAQVQINAQLLEQIAALEDDHRSLKPQTRQAHFFQSTLSYTHMTKAAILEQIDRCKTTLLPEAKREYDRVHEKRVYLEERINSLRKKRDSRLLEDLRDPQKRDNVVSWLVNSLNQEIQDLSATEQELQESTARAREELRLLQEFNVSNRKQEAVRNWKEELESEHGLRSKTFRRKRSLNVGRGLNAVSLQRRSSMRNATNALDMIRTSPF
jgi:hypothetical protein